MAVTEMMRARSILVVGGAGFVGNNLSRLLLGEYEAAELWIVDNLLSSDISNVPNDPRVRLIQGSIADERTLKCVPRHVEFVFHLACFHGNQSSIADPLADHANNTYTSLRLFEHLKDFKALRKVVYAAAGCAVAQKTYGAASATPEDAPVSLFHDSPYSISKLVGEMYGNYYWQRFGLPFVKARFQNVYGPGEILGAGRWRGTSHTVWRNVIPSFIWKALHAEALPLDNGGKGSRDFIYVQDIARGLVRCAERGCAGEAYNLASGVETSISDLARQINEHTGNTTPVLLLPAREWDRSGCRFGATDKARAVLDFDVTISLAEGLKRTVEWTIANRERIGHCIMAHEQMLRQGDVASSMA